MSDMESYLTTFLIIAAVLIILFQIVSLILFFRLLHRPHLRIKRMDALTAFKKTESLFHSYKLMPEYNRNMIKLWLESEDYGNTLIGNLIDYFHKIVLSVLLAFITLSITITIANLAFLKDNKELQRNYPSWVDITNKILNNLQIGIDSFTKIMLTCALAFTVLAITIVVRNFKENHKFKHLKVIAAAEEELKKEQV